MGTTTDERATPTREQVDRLIGVGEQLTRALEAHAAETRVVREPRIYGLHSRHSYYRDVACAAQPEHPGAFAARRRLSEYERELGVEMDRQTREGQRAERIIRARLRIADEREHEQRGRKALDEIRGFGTDGGISASSPGEAAAFVSPYFLLAQWAPFRAAARVFADSCFPLPMPSYGMKIYVPFVSGTDKVAEQTEGQAVTETEPATELEASPTVGTVTGQVTLSQQAHDRGGTGGGMLDALIGNQLHEQLDEAIDKYAINQAITNGTAISGNSGTYSNAKYLEDIAKARKEVADTAGTRLRATHLFSSTDFYGYYTRQLDEQNRPFMTPHFVPGFPVSTAADDFDAGAAPEWSRFLGTMMPGGVVWMADDSIPTVGTTSKIQILVSAPKTAIILLEDDAVLTTFMETKADTLRPVLNLRAYVACVTRHKAGTSVVTGAAYTTSLV